MADPPPPHSFTAAPPRGVTADPPPRNEPAPWTGRDIAVALFLVYIFWPALSLQLLQWSGFFGRIYGPDVVALCFPKAKGAEPPEATEAVRTRLAFLAGPVAARLDAVEAEARRLAVIRLNAWTQAAAFPLQALTVPVVFFALSGVPPGRMGLTGRRLGRNLLAGTGAWILITPLVFGVHWAVLDLFHRADPDAVQEHALTRLALQGPTRTEWALLAFSAVVAAPVLEEMVFRGALQPWFAGLPNGGHVAMAAALLAALAMRQSQLAEASRRGGEGLLTAALPALFVLALMPFYLAVARRPPRPDSPAVFGTALLFASMHASVWPTPVPLFVLGLGLGALASRTGSLVGPMVLHGLFNAVSVVSLAMGWWAG
jgi:membrane protease YdiL (CAAX protease family)